MSERTTLIKKAVLTSVGATSNFERVKMALEDAMQDIVKVGQDLIEDLEKEGKVKADNAQSFIKGLQDEASKKTEKVTFRVQGAAKDLGFISRREYETLLERIENIEQHLNIEPPCSASAEIIDETGEESEGGKKRSKKKAKSEADNASQN
ncbi:MAG: hypothetical protein IPM23_24615 [Candidatus Melainabacteria bacterium]|nr:hypothetical protein [Candidatus Melainabacteria bacterium]